MSLNLVATKGETSLFNINLTRDGSPIDLTSDSLTFRAKRNIGDADADSVIVKTIGDGITVTDALNGTAQLNISGADTAPLTVTELLLFWTLVLNEGSEDETVADGTLQIAVDTTPVMYVSVDEVRAEGLDDPPFSDATIQAAILVWQSFLERACRQWFYPLELELTPDGTDSDLMAFGVPIISIAEVRLNGDAATLDPRFYKVYNAIRYPFDRQNPRIQLIDNRHQELDIYTAPLRDGRLVFRKGRQNQYVRGTFGCVEPDGGPPPLIKRALLKLVIEKLAKPLYVSSSTPAIEPPPVLTGVLLEEWTDAHKVRYGVAGAPLKARAPGLAGITDDQEILNIIKLYKAPIGIATVAGPSWR